MLIINAQQSGFEYRTRSQSTEIQASISKASSNDQQRRQKTPRRRRKRPSPTAYYAKSCSRFHSPAHNGCPMKRTSFVSIHCIKYSSSRGAPAQYAKINPPSRSNEQRCFCLDPDGNTLKTLSELPTARSSCLACGLAPN